MRLVEWPGTGPRYRIIGGGFDIYNQTVFAMYAPNPLAVHAAHSIYFQILGEHGFIGLALFLMLGIVTWRAAGDLMSLGNTRPSPQFGRDLGAKMAQASMVGYAAAGGAFLSLAYFDLPYNIMIIVLLAKHFGLRTLLTTVSKSLPTIRTPNRHNLKEFREGLRAMIKLIAILLAAISYQYTNADELIERYDPDCLPLFIQGRHGPFDYNTATHGEKKLVERVNFDEHYQAYRLGKQKLQKKFDHIIETPAAGFSYTLWAFPNHPAALAAMEDLGSKHQSEKPPAPI